MKRFELIEHTADLGLVASGATLAEAFSNAAYGLFSLITNLSAVRGVEPRRLKLEEDDAEMLLVGWLNNLIYLFDVERILFKRFDITDLDGHRLVAVCYGEKYDPTRHTLKRGVKAATYHMIKVDADKNQVQVIFDV